MEELQFSVLKYQKWKDWRFVCIKKSKTFQKLTDPKAALPLRKVKSNELQMDLNKNQETVDSEAFHTTWREQANEGQSCDVFPQNIFNDVLSVYIIPLPFKG